MRLLLLSACLALAGVAAAQAQSVPDQCPDLNADLSITGSDLSAIAAVLGQPISDQRDLNADGSVTGADLSYVAAALGTSCLPESHNAIVTSIGGEAVITTTSGSCGLSDGGEDATLGKPTSTQRAPHLLVALPPSPSSCEAVTTTINWDCDIRLAGHPDDTTPTQKYYIWVGELTCFSTPSFNLQVTCQSSVYHEYDLIYAAPEQTTSPLNPVLCPSGWSSWLGRGAWYWIRPCWNVVHYATGTLLGWGCLDYGTVPKFHVS